MKILIVSGFLGAGKTTFIKALAKNTGCEIAVLENEYGASGIDGDRLAGALADGTVNIWEMTEGCICCSAKGDFAASVLTIANAVDPEYLVVEPTGVGMLGQIIQNLRQIEYERIAILPAITIVDIGSWQHYERDFPELYHNQIREAGTIVLSKTEHSSAEEIAAVQSMIREKNSEAEIVTDYHRLDRSFWMRFLNAEKDEKEHDASENSEALPDSFSLENISLESPERLILFLEELIRGHFGDIIRAKGQVPSGGLVLEFDVAGDRYSIRQPEPGPESEAEAKGKVVFIGRRIDKRTIRHRFISRNAKAKIQSLVDLSSGGGDFSWDFESFSS